MILSRLALTNWKNFQKMDVPLGGRVFVVGPNASGKSNLLDALRFFRDLAKQGGGLQKALSDRGGLSKVRCLAARREPNVTLAVDLAESAGEPLVWRYEIAIKQQVRGRRQPHLEYERVWRGFRQILNRPDEEDRKDPLRLTQTHLEQINANHQFRDLAKFFESILYLHLVPQLLRHPEAFVASDLPGDPFGRSFLERVARTPEKSRKSRLKRIEEALKLAVPQFKDLVLKTDERGTPHLEVVHEHWRPNAGRQREDQFSDGTLRLIALLWSLMDGDSPLLLEEPELSLHSAIVKQLPSVISCVQRQRGRQVFISTHSRELLADRGIGGEEVLLLTPGREGTTVELSTSRKEIRSLLEAGLSVAEAAHPKTAPERVAQLSLF
jgi:predicted ATPase